jgi:hypothetical protein
VSWFFEDPSTFILAGLLIEALLVVALVKTGRGVLILAMVGVLALVGLGLLVEHLVVTDHEQIEATLDGVTSALEANDVEGVLSFIDPAAGAMRANVRMALAGAHITDARVYDLVVEVNRQANPPTAQADFTGRVKGNYRGESADGEGMLLRKFTVDFRLHGDRWLMTAYEDRGGIGGHRDD